MNTRLARIRKDLGFRTQKDFAEVLEMPWRTLQTYEQATTAIPSTFILKLKNQFNISADWLLFGVGEIFLVDSPKKIEFENSDFILNNLTNDEVGNALTMAYIQKIITPTFQSIDAEQNFWSEVFKGHRDRISAVFYLLRVLKDIDIISVTLQNARQILLDAIDKHTITVLEHFKFMYLSKESLLKTIEQIDDLGCFIILTNTQKITDALAPFLNTIHVNNLKINKGKQ